MGRSIGFWGLVVSVYMFMIVMLAQKTTGQTQNFYTCGGGCYNVCFLLGGRGGAGRYPCYLNCLSSCFPLSVSDNQQLYYCHVGCSAQRCLQIKKDSAREKCFGSCGDACRT